MNCATLKCDSVLIKFACVTKTEGAYVLINTNYKMHGFAFVILCALKSMSPKYHLLFFVDKADHDKEYLLIFKNLCISSLLRLLVVTEQ